ncbi:MAG: hypothetical protein K1X65_00900 [Caldilineales bacterium]|nr:hypothetical protein [Caldilineales bacterium]MCW5857450.1 hypothetical protein [Caldilineales bacterium]
MNQQNRQSKSYFTRLGRMAVLTVGLLAGLLLRWDEAATSSAPDVTAQTWPPYVTIVPAANNDDAYVSASAIGRPFVAISAMFGSTSHDWSHTQLEYSDETGAYEGRVAEHALFEHCPTAEACLRLLPASSQLRPTEEVRVMYDFENISTNDAPDLALVSAVVRFEPDPFDDDADHKVVLLIPPKGPAPLPPGWWQVPGSVYVVESDGPNGQLNASLTIYYDPDILRGYGYDEATLKMLAWNPPQGVWAPLDKSEVSTRRNWVGAPISQLTAYVLAAPQPKRLWLPWVNKGGE